MSLEDAIKEVAKAIQSHADAIREDIAQRKADTAALGQLMRVEYDEGYSEEDENEPAPVVSLAEKRKEKQAAEPLKSELIAEAIKNIRPDGNAPNSQELPGKTYADHSAEVTEADLIDADINLAELTEDYVIECFKKAMLPKPGTSQQENKARIRDILKKYGCVGPLLKDGKVSVKPDQWAALTQELLS